MQIARVLNKGQIVIPSEIRKKMDLKPGDRVALTISEKGVLISPLRENFTENARGLVKGKLSTEELEVLYAERP